METFMFVIFAVLICIGSVVLAVLRTVGKAIAKSASWLALLLLNSVNFDSLKSSTGKAFITQATKRDHSEQRETTTAVPGEAAEILMEAMPEIILGKSDTRMIGDARVRLHFYGDGIQRSMWVARKTRKGRTQHPNRIAMDSLPALPVDEAWALTTKEVNTYLKSLGENAVAEKVVVDGKQKTLLLDPESAFCPPVNPLMQQDASAFADMESSPSANPVNPVAEVETKPQRPARKRTAANPQKEYVGVLANMGRLLREDVARPYECFMVELELSDVGTTHRVWGQDLHRAVLHAGVKRGDPVKVRLMGKMDVPAKGSQAGDKVSFVQKNLFEIVRA